MQSVNNSKIQFTENYFSSHGRHTLSLSYTYNTSLSMMKAGVNLNLSEILVSLKRG